jgi:transposase
MKDDSTVYVGLDVHKESITAAYAIGGGDVEVLGKIATTKTEIDRLCVRLQSKSATRACGLRGGSLRIWLASATAEQRL